MTSAHATPWVGTVNASGFAFDEALLAREELVARLLSLWSDGARLGRAGTRWFLVGLPPRRVDARQSPGTPLAWHEGRWVSARFGDAEVRAAPLDAVLDLYGGVTHVRPFAALEQVHPVDLLALDAPAVLPVTPLEPPPPPIARVSAAPNTLDQLFKTMLESLEAPRPGLVPVAPAEAPRVSPFVRMRAWLAGVAARRAEREAAERARLDAAERERGRRRAEAERARLDAAERERERRRAEAERQREAAARGPSPWARLRSWLGESTEAQAPPPRPQGPSLFARLAAWLGSGAPRPQRDAVNELRTELARPPPPARPLDPSLWERLARWLAPAGNGAPPAAGQPGVLARVSGPRGPDAQKSYLEDLRRRFLEGDLGEALRRAIPLGGTGTPGPVTNLVPTRRNELSLLTPSASGAPTMAMQGSEYEQMRKLYREAADKLIAEGRIEEAAYLLARLLNDAQAGVALLEKHGKLELAAQLATVQHLPELERIRLWLLAGRTEEAIRVVRGSRDFAALVTALNTRAPELARRLRAVWGEYLAQHDRFTEAIVATAPLPEPPENFPTWVENAFQTGGAAAATALAVDLGRFPEHAPAARERLDALLADDQNSALTVTAASLLAAHAPKAPTPMYRDLWRRLMRGAAQQHRAVERNVTDTVLRLAADPALQTDAVMPAAAAWRPEAPPREVAAPVVPGLPLFDVAELPKGRRVLAEGAAGLRVVARDGKTVRQHLVKADGFVAGPPGTQVLVLSRDGHLTRVWKLHPRTLELTSWFQARLDAWSPRYDGLCWPVGLEDALVLLDPATPSPMEWWRVPATTCRELDLVDGPQPQVIALAKDVGTNQTWRMLFDVGAQKLERRLGPEQQAFRHGTQLSTWELRVLETGSTVLHLVEPKVNVPLTAGARTFLATKAGLVMTCVSQGWCVVSVVDWRSGQGRVCLRLSRVTQPVLRELAGGVVVCDEFGRVTPL